MGKSVITNRQGQKMVVLVEGQDQPKGLVFVMHGLGGFKEQAHIASWAEVFREKGFTVVRYDSTNATGESEGEFEKATLTNYYNDLEDVIAWAGGQNWYQEPFVLIGHSLGGFSVARYAQKYPEKVKAVAPIAPVVNFALSMENAKKNDPNLASWQATGWKEWHSTAKPGLIKRLPWSHMEDRKNHDLLKEANKMTMPVFVAVGERDTSTPAEHVKIFFDAIPGDKKELYLIPGAPHSYSEAEHLSDLKSHLSAWIDKID